MRSFEIMGFDGLPIGVGDLWAEPHERGEIAVATVRVHLEVVPLLSAGYEGEFSIQRLAQTLGENAAHVVFHSGHTGHLTEPFH